MSLQDKQVACQQDITLEKCQTTNKQQDEAISPLLHSAAGQCQAALSSTQPSTAAHVTPSTGALMSVQAKHTTTSATHTAESTRDKPCGSLV
jgi:hypothetical protein